MSKTIIHSDAAPKAVGTYSQAVKVGNTVYLSGQIGLDPASGHIVVRHPVALDSSQHFPIVAVAAGHVLVEAGPRVVAFTVTGRSPTTTTTS